MAQSLKAPATLSEDGHLVPSSDVPMSNGPLVPVTPAPGNQMPFSGLSE